MEEPPSLAKQVGVGGVGGASTRLFEIREAKGPSAIERQTDGRSDRRNERQADGRAGASTASAAATAVKLLRGIHISELYGTTINPEPKGGDAKLASSPSSSSSSSSTASSSKRRQKEISASSSKSEYVVDKEVVVTEHLTENLLRQLTGCQDLR